MNHNNLKNYTPEKPLKIKDIKNWFEIAIPEPTIEQACIQIGCHAEECAEMFESIDDRDAMLDIDYVAKRYKSQHDELLFKLYDATKQTRIDLLDSLCDQIVTAIGVAHMLGMDIDGALEEVNRSNHSKFEDGAAVFDNNGKITKGKHYGKPELSKFIGVK